jgi:O-antigen/teichoic acid export membrane protein
MVYFSRLPIAPSAKAGVRQRAMRTGDPLAPTTTAMHDVARRVALGSVFHLSSQLVLMGCGYLVSVVLARALGPAGFGAYGVVYSFLLAVELIGRFGIPQAAGKLVAEQRRTDHAIEATGLTLSLLVYLALFAGVWLAAPALEAGFGIPDGTRLFRIAAFDIPLYGAFATLFHILNGRRSFVQESALIALYGLAKAAGVAVLVQAGPSVAGALLVSIAASAIALAATIVMVGRAPLRLSLAHKDRILRVAMPIALLVVGNQLLQVVDLWILAVVGAHLHDAVLGHYVAAVNVARIPNFVSNAMSAVLLTSIASAMGAGDRAVVQRTLQGSMRFVLIVLLPGCALMAVNAREILVLLFSADYAPAAPLLTLLAFAQGLFLTLFLTLVAVLIGAGRAGVASVIALGVLPLAVVLDAALVRAFDAPGAALGALLSCAAAATTAGLMVQRHVGALLPAGLVGIIVAAGASVTVSAVIRAEGPWLVGELGGVGLLYLTLLAASGLIRPADLRFLRAAGG